MTGMLDRGDIALHMTTIKRFASQSYVIVEVGPDMGDGSTRAIWRGILDSEDYDVKKWVTVDIDDHINPQFRPTLENWHMVVGDSREESTVNTVFSLIRPDYADLIFIDTIHNKDFLAKELAVWEKISFVGTVWLFHDTWMSGKYNPMTDAIKEFAKSNPWWEYVDISKECNGLGALIPVDKSLSFYGVEQY